MKNTGLFFPLLILFIFLILAWAQPRGVGDLYIGLAAGRDIVQGIIAQADQWSFLTQSRIWINQNWGSHLLLYITFYLGGEWVLLLLKMVCLVWLALCLILYSYQRGAPPPAGILAAGLVIFCFRSQIDLRPNLFSLLIFSMLLYLLDCCRQKKHLIWLAAGLVIAWANMHGGFMLGLIVLFLFVFHQCLPGLFIGFYRGNSIIKFFTKLNLGLLPFFIALAGAGLFTPFHIFKAIKSQDIWLNWNLTHSLGVAGNSMWQSGNEWQPFFQTPLQEGSWEFLLLFLLVTLPLAKEIVTSLKNFSQTNSPAFPNPKIPDRQPQLEIVLFDFFLLGLLVIMTILHRRFIPFALIALTPRLARLIKSTILDPAKTTVIFRFKPYLPFILFLLFLIFCISSSIELWRHYHPDNPLQASQNLTSQPELFKRMVAFADLPSSPVDFLRDNQIKGRIFADWQWEGFIRWQYPALKLAVGGRAQQIYRETDFKLYLQVVAGQNAQKLLAKNHINLVLISLQGHIPLVNELLYSPGASWTVIYLDNRAIILADSKSEIGNHLAVNLLEEKLSFPAPHLKYLSKAMAIYTPVGQKLASKISSKIPGNHKGTIGPNFSPAHKIITLIKKAKTLKPLPISFQLLDKVLRTWPPALADWTEIFQYLQAERKQFHLKLNDRPQTISTYNCLKFISAATLRLYILAGKKALAQQEKNRMINILDQIKQTNLQWE